MKDVGAFNVTQLRIAGGLVRVGCQELPSFTMLVPEDTQLQGRVKEGLSRHLASRYGIRAELNREVDVVRYRCLVPN